MFSFVLLSFLLLHLSKPEMSKHVTIINLLWLVVFFFRWRFGSRTDVRSTRRSWNREGQRRLSNPVLSHHRTRALLHHHRISSSSSSSQDQWGSASSSSKRLSWTRCRRVLICIQVLKGHRRHSTVFSIRTPKAPRPPCCLHRPPWVSKGACCLGLTSAPPPPLATPTPTVNTTPSTRWTPPTCPTTRHGTHRTVCLINNLYWHKQRRDRRTSTLSCYFPYDSEIF